VVGGIEVGMIWGVVEGVRDDVKKANNINVNVVERGTVIEEWWIDIKWIGRTTEFRSKIIL